MFSSGGTPDGAAVDVGVEGHYDVDMYEGARVLKIFPAGDVLVDIAVLAQCPTMPVHEIRDHILQCDK